MQNNIRSILLFCALVPAMPVSASAFNTADFNALKTGVKPWNSYRAGLGGRVADLSGAQLKGMNL
ncbi:MAG: hypothetical protein HGA81_01880, partial [Chlorobium limicola]|nr:hypothetical protein [Chlorobium limicola]